MTGPESESEWLTVAECAARLGVDPRQVRRLLDRLESTDKGQDPQRTHKGAPLTVVRLSAVVSLVGGGVDVGNPTDKANGQRTESKGQGTEKPTAKGQGTRDTQEAAVDLVSVELAAARLAQAEEKRRADVAEARLEEIARERDDLRETKDKALQLLDQQQRLSLADRVKIEQLESELQAVKKIGASEENREDTTAVNSGSPASEADITSLPTEQLRPSFLQRLFGRRR